MRASGFGESGVGFVLRLGALSFWWPDLLECLQGTIDPEAF